MLHKHAYNIKTTVKITHQNQYMHIYIHTSVLFQALSP